MTDADRRLLETIPTAQVLVLSKELAKESSTVRIGGDYVHEAAALIRAQRSRVLTALQASR